MRARRTFGVVALGLALLGVTGCGDDADDPIEASTTCDDFRDRDQADRADAVATLGPADGWDDASVEEVDAVCAETSKATLADVFAAAVRGSLTTASALVETYCRQADVYVEAVEEEAQHLDDLDSEGLEEQGTELSNAALRLPPLTDDEQALVDECTQRAGDAALLLVPD